MSRARWFLLAGLLVSLLLAGVASNLASSDPDGLDTVTREGCRYSGDEIVGGECMARDAREHEVGGPLADYGVAGIDNPYLSTGLAGVVGVLLVFGIGAVVFRLARRRPEAGRGTGPDGSDGADGPGGSGGSDAGTDSAEPAERAEAPG